MSRTAWKPSLEERAVLWIIRQNPGSAHKSPRVTEHLFRWVRGGNRSAISEIGKALRNERGRGKGRPQKAFAPPMMHALLYEALACWLRSLPHADVRALLRRHGVPEEVVKTVARGQHKKALTLLIKSWTGVGERRIASELAEGRRLLRQPPRPLSLADIARSTGRLNALTDFLDTVPPAERAEVLRSFFPDIFDRHSS